PAIAEMVVGIIKKNRDLTEKKYFDPYRKAIIKPNNFSLAELNRRIMLDPCRDKIICRCERVTEGEILDALSRNISVKTRKGVKMRTRAGMGTCQGKFCSPRVDKVIESLKI
ncbi:MAG: (2Fe-2S)-binding protein, partial [Spirochaetales bacterium]|nr:(2Fe-2S)-binding protein [Spirochaetales bacterium]